MAILVENRINLFVVLLPGCSQLIWEIQEHGLVFWIPIWICQVGTTTKCNALPALQNVSLAFEKAKSRKLQSIKKILAGKRLGQIAHVFREFLKKNFNAYKIRYLGSDEGLFTGYYEPTLYGQAVARI